MKCDRVEQLLPLYVDEELPADEQGAVEAHLEGCPLCEASLAFYRDLEHSLGARRELRPDPAVAANRIVRRMNLRRARRAFRFPLRIPALVSAAFILVGVIMLFLWDTLETVFSRAGSEITYRFMPALERFSRGVLETGAGEEWMIFTVYLGIFAIILLTGSWMVLRFVKE
jgi:anti-sigma factor RsiW